MSLVVQVFVNQPVDLINRNFVLLFALEGQLENLYGTVLEPGNTLYKVYKTEMCNLISLKVNICYDHL